MLQIRVSTVGASSSPSTHNSTRCVVALSTKVQRTIEQLVLKQLGTKYTCVHRDETHPV